MYQAQIILDSINPQDCRLTTALWEYPLIVHNEHLRHRGFSFSVASNRAIPTKTLIEKVIRDPYIPDWQHNQPGMAASAKPVSQEARDAATNEWLRTRDEVVKACFYMQMKEEEGGLNMHKQWVNRLLTPWQWVTVLFSGTDETWANHDSQRCHPAAQPDYQKIAVMGLEARMASTPTLLDAGEYHVPFLRGDEKHMCIRTRKRISAARNARTSLENHFGEFSQEKDFELHDRLKGSRPVHASPFEHIAMSMDNIQRYRNFRGFRQYREELKDDTVYSFNYNEWKEFYYGN